MSSTILLNRVVRTSSAYLPKTQIKYFFSSSTYIFCKGQYICLLYSEKRNINMYDLIDLRSLLKTSTELLEHPPKLGIIYVVKYSKRNSIVQINKCVLILRFNINVRLIHDITKPIKLAYKSAIILVITL